MYISKSDLEKKKILWNKEYSIGYELNQELIAKKFQNLDSNQMNQRIKKIMLAGYYQMIPGLIVPIDTLQTEKGIEGYIQRKQKGIPFAEHYASTPFGLSLDEITQYIINVEKTVRSAHNEGMFFPDLATLGNVLYHPITKKIAIVDYEGNQIKNVE